MSEQPFKVHVSDAEIALLRQKLDLVRFPDELEDARWDYGAPLADIQRLVARWKDGYDWRKAEEKVNRIPQFTRDIKIDGFTTLNIHYIHQRSTVAKAIPLLFVHGCAWISVLFCDINVLTRIDNTLQGLGTSLRSKDCYRFLLPHCPSIQVSMSLH